MGDKMKVSPKEEFRDLAARNGWSCAFAEGYVDGRAARRHGRQITKYPLADLEQYREGFLAGYSLIREKRCGAVAGLSDSESSAA
jgi:hypothetical protein